MQKRKRYQLRYAAGLYWLLDMEQTGEEYVRPVTMNECGAYIWQNYTESVSETEIAEMLHQRYGISAEEALRDIKEFIEQLQKQGILCENGTAPKGQH